MMVLSDHFYITLPQVSLFVSAIALGRIVTSYLSGVLADKIGRKKILLCSISCISITFIFMPISNNFYIAMFLMFLAGMGQGMIDSAGVALVFDVFKEKAHSAIGYVQVFVSLGIFLSPAISNLLYQQDIFFGYYFWIVGLISIICLIGIFVSKFPPILLPTNDRYDHANDKFIIEPNPIKEGFIIGFSVFLYSIFVTTLTTWIGTYSYEVIGLGTANSIRVLTGYSVGCIIGGMVISRMLNRIHPSTFYVLNPILMLITLIIYPVINNPNIGVMIFVIVGFFGGIIIGFALSLIGELFPSKKATASGTIMTAGAFGTLLTPIITSFIFNQFGIKFVYYFMIFILCIFIFVAFILKIRYKAIKN